jgi:nitrogen fixation NifU-like protein
MYITTVMDHCNHPRNTRVIEDADGSGEVGNPRCAPLIAKTTWVLKRIGKNNYFKDLIKQPKELW